MNLEIWICETLFGPITNNLTGLRLSTVYSSAPDKVPQLNLKLDLIKDIISRTVREKLCYRKPTNKVHRFNLSADNVSCLPARHLGRKDAFRYSGAGGSLRLLRSEEGVQLG